MSLKLVVVVLIALTGQVLADVEHSEDKGLLKAAVHLPKGSEFTLSALNKVAKGASTCYQNVAQIIHHVWKQTSLTFRGYQLYLNLTRKVLVCFSTSSDKIYDCGITAFGEYKRFKHLTDGDLQHSKLTLSQLVQNLPKCLSQETLPSPPPKFENLSD